MDSRFYDSIGKYKVLSAEEEKELGKRKNWDEAAREQLITSNLRLVVKIANEYKCSGMEDMDLIQEGIDGLMEAVDNYDYTRPNRFSSYAGPCIRFAILHAMDKKGRMIDVPKYKAEQISKVCRAEEDIIKDLGIDPTDDLIAQRTGLSLKNVEECMRQRKQVESLNAPIGESEDDGCLGDFIEDVPGMSPAEWVEDGEFETVMNRAFDVLEPRDEQIVKMICGLEPYERPMTKTQIGRKLGISSERVNQLYQRALKRIRESEEAAYLREYCAA